MSRYFRLALVALAIGFGTHAMTRAATSHAPGAIVADANP